MPERDEDALRSREDEDEFFGDPAQEGSTHPLHERWGALPMGEDAPVDPPFEDEPDPDAQRDWDRDTEALDIAREEDERERA